MTTKRISDETLTDDLMSYQGTSPVEVPQSYLRELLTEMILLRCEYKEQCELTAIAVEMSDKFRGMIIQTTFPREDTND